MLWMSKGWQNYGTGQNTSFHRGHGKYRGGNNIYMWGGFCNIDRQFNYEGQYNYRNNPNADTMGAQYPVSQGTMKNAVMLQCSNSMIWQHPLELTSYNKQWLAQICHKHNNWQLIQWQKPGLLAVWEVEPQSTDAVPEEYTGLSGATKKTTWWHAHTQISNSIQKQRCWATIHRAPVWATSPRKHTKWKCDLWHKITDNKLDETIGYGILEEVILNKCLTHELQKNFIYTPEYYMQNEKSTITGLLFS